MNPRLNGNGHDEPEIIVPDELRLERQREEYNNRLKSEVMAEAHNWLGEHYRGQPRICLSEGLRGTLHPKTCRCENCWSVREVEERKGEVAEEAFNDRELENLQWWLDHGRQPADIPVSLALVRLCGGSWERVTDL